RLCDGGSTASIWSAPLRCRGRSLDEIQEGQDEQQAPPKRASSCALARQIIPLVGLESRLRCRVPMAIGCSGTAGVKSRKEIKRGRRACRCGEQARLRKGHRRIRAVDQGGGV